MEVKEHTLVLVTPRRGTPSKPCWGLVIKRYDSGNFSVKIGKRDHDQIVAYPEQVRAVVHANGSLKDPRKAIAVLGEEILIKVIKELSPQKEEEALTNLIKVNTLVIVLPETQKAHEAFWGIVGRKMPDGNFDVIVKQMFGKIGREKIFAKPSQLIPVIQTDGSTLNPKRALRRNWDKLLMYIVFKYEAQERIGALQPVMAALSLLEGQEDVLL